MVQKEVCYIILLDNVLYMQCPKVIPSNDISETIFEVFYSASSLVWVPTAPYRLFPLSQSPKAEFFDSNSSPVILA